MIDRSKIVDLSHGIRRKGENFPFHSDYVGNRDEEYYCVRSNIFTGSHVATHVETPHHHMRDGLDALTYPLTHLVGDAVCLDLSKKAPEEPVTVEELKQYAHLIHEGDIILFWTGCDKFHRTERWMDYRYFEVDAMQYVQSFHPRAIGVDSFGIEIPGARTGEPDHMACFNNNCAVIECLDNLEQIANERVSVLMLTIPMDGVDACPVRAVAIRGDGHFSPRDVISLGHHLYDKKERLQYTFSRAGDVVDLFYGMTDVFLDSHVGTHVVFERHHKIDGVSCWDFPLEKLIGEAVTLDVSGRKCDEPITLEELLPYKDMIREGDIIFLYTGYADYYRTKHETYCRTVTPEAMEFLVSFRPGAIGVDAFGLEPEGKRNVDEPNRALCFRNGIAVVENLTNLDRIVGRRTDVFILPLPMEGVDASPIRPVAIENFRP